MKTVRFVSEKNLRGIKVIGNQKCEKPIEKGHGPGFYRKVIISGKMKKNEPFCHKADQYKPERNGMPDVSCGNRTVNIYFQAVHSDKEKNIYCYKKYYCKKSVSGRVKKAGLLCACQKN